MITQPLSQPARGIVSRLWQTMEARKVNAEEINEVGWKWGGAEFENGIEQLRIQLENEGIGPVSDAIEVPALL